MAAAGLITLNAPDNAHRPPNTGDSAEFGDSYQTTINNLNTMLAALFGGTGVANTIIGAGSTKALAAADSGKTVALDTATGSVVTLPTATGSGNRFKFFVKTLATSNSHIIYCHDANGGAGADNFIGLIPGARTDSTNALLAFAAASNSNTITLNRTTTGSVNKGEWIEVTDVAANVWEVSGFLSATGAAFATPFSHT